MHCPLRHRAWRAAGAVRVSEHAQKASETQHHKEQLSWKVWLWKLRAVIVCRVGVTFPSLWEELQTVGQQLRWCCKSLQESFSDCWFESYHSRGSKVTFTSACVSLFERLWKFFSVNICSVNIFVYLFVTRVCLVTDWRPVQGVPRTMIAGVAPPHLWPIVWACSFSGLAGARSSG